MVTSKEFDERLEKILMAVWECGYTIDEPETVGMSVNEAKQSLCQLFKDALGERDELKENTFGSAVDWRGYNKTMVDRNTLRAEIKGTIEGDTGGSRS